MLYLSKNDLESILDCDAMIESIERAYAIQASENYIMPDRIHIHYDDNTLLYMPCVIESSYCTKLATVFPKNHEKSLPVVDGIVVFNDKSTGQICALMDGKSLTAIRTGAVGGTAVKYYAGSDAKVLGIIGCGVQGYYQALFADHVKDFDKILLFDSYGYNPKFKDTFGHKLEIAESPDMLVEKSDVVITATTSNVPIFKTKVVKNKTFIGIGSFKPNMREYSDDFIKKMDHIIADTPFAKYETGDLKIPIENDIIASENIQLFKQERLEGTVFFKSVGMALFDNVVAEKIYEIAKDKKIGQVLEG